MSCPNILFQQEIHYIATCVNSFISSFLSSRLTFLSKVKKNKKHSGLLTGCVTVSPSSQSAALWNVRVVSAGTSALSVNLASCSTKASVWPAAQREPLPVKLTAWVSTVGNPAVIEFNIWRSYCKKVQLLTSNYNTLWAYLQHTILSLPVRNAD